MNSKKYFETVADQWDTMREGFFSENVREKAFETASLQPSKLAADVGAGTGFITEGLIKRGLKVIAVDQSKAMLDKLKLKFPSSSQIDCRIGEAEKLPVEDDSVDYVFANMFLHHVKNPQLAIKEMTRILKSGGKLVISDLDEHDFQFLKIEHHDRWMGFKREDVKQWFREAGLKKVSLDCAGEKCSSESNSSDESAAIDIFVASGEK
ncbi:MAG: methyltransferase domain-containing protein [Candidatus Aminicenantes bacterium]|nr:methyltransferase domain-containing protein [Candidatus Aminicenantes bacterium]